MILSDLFRPFYNLLMNLITCIVTLFIHRDKKIILMGSWYGRRFGGNTRYLFQYLSENKEKYGLKKVIWVTREESICSELRNLGYEVYMMKSKEGLYYHFKAGIHALNVNISTSTSTSKTVNGDIMGELSMGAHKLFLNHGVAAIKGSKFLEDESLSKKDKLLVKVYKIIYGLPFFRHWMLVAGGWDKNVFIAPTEKMIERDKARTAQSKNKKYVVAGFPELCEPLKYTSREQAILKQLEMHNRVILYVPTYRTDNRTGYKHPLDDEKLRHYLKENNYFWIDKMHPGAKKDMEAKDYDSSISMLLESEFDMNIIVNHVDVLISDYSSAVQKAVYYHKPIVNYWADIEGYKKYGNGLVKSFFDDAVGEQAYNVDELLVSISNSLSDNYFAKNEEIYKEKFQYFFGGKKSNYEEIAEKLFEQIAK